MAAGVPRPPGNALTTLRAVRHDPLGTFTGLSRAYGPIVRVPMPGARLYLVSDPGAIQEAMTATGRNFAKGAGRSPDPERPGFQPLQRILGAGLLTSAGEHWRRQRRLINPLFHHSRIADYCAVFAELAERTADSWRDGEVRDIHTDMTELTLAIVGRTVFDVDLDATIMRRIRQWLTDNMDTARRGSNTPWSRFLDKLPLPSTRRWNADRRALDQLVYQLIAARRASGATGTDLLSLLLSAQDAETGVAMNDLDVRDEAVTLLLAGHETTANALAWAFHLLGRWPQTQRELRAELDEVLDGRLPGAADLPRLPYTRAVFNEAMRLYPPAWIVARRLLAARDVCGYRLPASSMLLFCTYSIHRDPQWWPQPEQFRPQRWLTKDNDRPRYSYFPFGGGPRQCIGNGFAEAEGMLALATLVRRWYVTPVSDAPIRPRPLITLRPATGVPMTVSTVDSFSAAARSADA
jgi:cytochrome P450